MCNKMKLKIRNSDFCSHSLSTAPLFLPLSQDPALWADTDVWKYNPAFNVGKYQLGYTV